MISTGGAADLPSIFSVLGQPELDDFAKYLWEEFPEKDDVMYRHDDPIQSVKEEE